MSIYDRKAWPSPENNPLVIMLERGEEWFSNAEIVAALGSPPGKSILAQWPTLAEQIGEDHTGIVARGFITPTTERRASHGGQERVFSKKALVIIAMRAQTANAAAFRDCVAERLAISAA
jgi:prophage antirepressor-like protein